MKTNTQTMQTMEKKEEEDKETTKKDSFYNKPCDTLSELLRDSIISSSSSREIKNEEIISKKLLLSGKLFFNKNLLIDQKGLVGCSLRKKYDCSTFFGVSNIKDYKGVCYNDFIINYSLEFQIPLQSGRIFGITFINRTKEFKLILVNTSVILYYIIENYLYFQKDKEYFLFLGRVFLIISYRKINKEHIILIHIEQNSKILFEKTFTEKDTPLTIGRDSSNKIIINNPSVSKKHGEITYEEETELFKFRDLRSTNQSIMLLKDDDQLKIKGEMKFKLDDIPFKITELP